MKVPRGDESGIGIVIVLSGFGTLSQISIVVYLVALFILFTIIFNCITVIAIVMKKIGPSYILVQLGFAINIIVVAFGIWLWADAGSISTYDLVWMMAYILLLLWYGVILVKKTLMKEEGCN